ncbi:MAG: hypothetical protein ACFN00_00585 [Flavobacteriaceae bacterium]
MKIFSVLKAFFILLVFSLLSLVISCESRAETVSCFPSQIINVQLNLTFPAYAIDLNTKGWIYINEQQSGTRGLILVKTGTGFKVYDRNAPHLCPDANTTLEVQNNIKIVCPKDGAEWILQDGTPIKGSGLPPKFYDYSYNAATGELLIYY